MPHDPNELIEFNYRVFKFEYIIIKLFLAALSLYGLYKLGQLEFDFRKPVPTPAIQTPVREPPAYPPVHDFVQRIRQTEETRRTELSAINQYL